MQLCKALHHLSFGLLDAMAIQPTSQPTKHIQDENHNITSCHLYLIILCLNTHCFALLFSVKPKSNNKNTATFQVYHPKQHYWQTTEPFLYSSDLKIITVD
jgi:hypothetical protein